MKRKLLVLVIVAAVGAACLGLVAHAQPTSPEGLSTPQISDCSEAAPGACARMERRAAHGQRMGRGARMLAAANNPVSATILNLRGIERIYRHEGRESELPALYQDVLKRTDNGAIRNFAYFRLARLEMRDKKPEQALEMLQKSLDENLQRVK